MSCIVALSKTHVKFGFPTRFDTNQLVQSQKQARSLKFWIYLEEGLYYLCIKNKDADQLCSYCTADLHLCFCICRLLLFFSSGCSLFSLQDINEPSVQLKLKVKNTDTGMVEPVSFNISSDKFRVLLNGKRLHFFFSSPEPKAHR